jgi:CspA family cold shock protein
MRNGTVKLWNADRGFGFIQPADGSRDIFVHVSALSDGMVSLQVGQKVQYAEGEDAKSGKTKATNVTLL